MTDSVTTNYSWSYPTVNGDGATWGGTLNTTIQAIDTQVKTNSDAAAQRTNNLSDLGNLATARTNLGVTATGADTTYTKCSNNLSDLGNAGTARTNLGLGSAALQSTTDATKSFVAAAYAATTNNFPKFDSNGSVTDSGVAVSDALTKSGNLASLGSTSTARSNLGLGSIATKAITVSTSAASGTPSDGDLWVQYTA